MGKKKYFVENLPDDWDTVLLEMAEAGAGPEEILAQWRINYAAHSRFLIEDPIYKEAWERAEILRKAFYYRTGRENLGSDSRKFNLGLYAFTMKNLFKWRDTPLTPNTDGSGKLPDKLQETEIKTKYRNEERAIQ